MTYVLEQLVIIHRPGSLRDGRIGKVLRFVGKEAMVGPADLRMAEGVAT